MGNKTMWSMPSYIQVRDTDKQITSGIAGALKKNRAGKIK